MGVLSTMFEKRASRYDPANPKDPGLTRLFGDYQTTASGAMVNPTTAQRECTVYACCGVLSQTVAQLPLILYRRVGESTKERATDHPAYRLMHDKPNDAQTSFGFRETMQWAVALRGNAVAEIVSTSGSSAQQIIPIHPDKVRIYRGPNGLPVYEVYGSGPNRVLLPDEVLHIVGRSEDGIQGVSPIEWQRESIGAAISARDFGSRLWGNNAKPGGVLEVPGSLDEEAAARLRERWKFAQQSANKVAVLEGGTKFTPITISPEDAQFLETRKYTRSEIAAIFRVPLHMINDLERATFSNIEQQSIDFVTYTMLPWLTRWEQSLNASILTDADRRSGLFFEFNVSGLLRGDAAARASYYNSLFQVGALSQNDIRRLENENPIENGNKYFVPLNMQDSAQPVVPQPARQTT